MSRIDDLISAHCSSGVRFRALADVAETVSGLSGKTKADFSGGNARFVSYKNAFANLAVDQAAPDFVKVADGERQNRLREGDIVFTGSSETADEVGMSSVVLTEPDEPLYLNSFCFAVRFRDADLLLPGFAKHLFRAQSVRADIRRSAAGVTRINISKQRFMNIRIPVPPLEVQAEIVRVLDQFTQLEAELEARRVQYAFYRDQLLNLSKSVPRFVTLPEVSTNRDGRRRPVTKSARISGAVPYYGASGIVDHVSDYIFDGDYLLISEDGANLLARSTPIAFSISGKTWVNNHAHVLEFDTYAERRFVEIYLNSIDLASYVSGGAQPKLNQANLNRIRIPWPLEADRERIVSVLDKFDAFVNNLSEGLPAELAARRQQYEYYRDKLLAFEEAVA